MPYQFCCPQGHVLQGELTAIGQVVQCPACGLSLFVPPPDCGVTMSGGLMPAAGTLPAGNNSAELPIAMAADPPPVPAYPEDLAGFDTPETTHALPQPQEILAMPGGALPPILSQPPLDLPAEAVLPDFASAAAGIDPSAGFARTSVFRAEPVEAAPTPRRLHIRCPSGHVVKASRDLLGRLGRCPACKKTFELRYEDSIEFRRRAEKTLRREENLRGPLWVVWPFLAALLVFAAIVGAVLLMNR
jgi:hypothetical protein